MAAAVASRSLLNAVAACFVVVLFGGCGPEHEPQARPPAPPIPAPALPSVNTAPAVTGELVEVAELVSNLEPYVGRTVGVVGTIDEVYTRYAFRLRGAGSSSGEGLLIVSAAANEWNYAEYGNRTVSVTGIVGRFSAERARQVTGRTIPPELRARKNEPFVAATRLTAHHDATTPLATPGLRD